MPAALIDTNILLYAISTAPEETDKRARAREILAGSDWCVSIQVLQEFYVNATRPPHPAMSHEAAAQVLEQLLAGPVQVNDADVLRRALALRGRYSVSFWDANVIASAQVAGATTLYSEDLSHGQDYSGVRVINPFK